MNAPDRIPALMAQNILTGIDFIYIHPDQVTVDVYFYKDPLTLAPPFPNVFNNDKIRIYTTAGIPALMQIDSAVFTNNGGSNFLRLKIPSPGNFSLYSLAIDDPKIDPWFNDVQFSFKANCPSDLDCKPSDHECAQDELVDFPIDYSARDFWSFRKALLDFASLRYPDWPDRLAADAGVMMAEMMSAVGDEMAYYQDRIGREAYLETATQRRSVRGHAGLVDYDISDGRGAFAWLDITVKPGMNGNISAGADFSAIGENGSQIDFEAGLNLDESINNIQYSVDANRNQYEAYRWDEDQDCLMPGTTELFIVGLQQANLLTFDGLAPNDKNGKWVLLVTKPTNPSQLERAWMVRLTSVKDTIDPVLGNTITHLRWDEEQALPFEMDMTVLYVRANLIPSTAGRTFNQYLITGATLQELPVAAGLQLEIDAFNSTTPIVQAIEREGSNNSIAYLCTLLDSNKTNLVWLPGDGAILLPELNLEEREFDGVAWKVKQTWNWKRRLVGVSSSGSQDTDYTLIDGNWKRVVGYWRNGIEFVHRDYAESLGMTIRFGDGEFGIIPTEKSVFKVQYRLGPGKDGNVAPNSITHFDKAINFIESVTNPLNGTDGKDAETFAEVKQSAPEAFKRITYRAVRPEDYAEAVERLPWVQKAGASFRWTGSWLTAFATPDPLNSVTISDPWRVQLRNQLDRYRQAGREAVALDPQYADLDLEIEVCASPDTFPGELMQRILLGLFGKKGLNPLPGFFSPDRFSFGGLLERSQLEATIQNVPGVRAVEKIMYRKRGELGWQEFTEFSLNPGKDTIIRVENDPTHPERGTLKMHIHGGA